ncbi:hypothetical protein AAHB54_29565, partial [Bacillus cereus]
VCLNKLLESVDGNRDKPSYDVFAFIVKRFRVFVRRFTEILYRKVDLAGNFAVTRRTVSRCFISVLYK